MTLEQSHYRFIEDQEIQQHQRAEDDPVPSEDLEVVLSDVVHQESNDEDGNNL